MTNEPIAVIRGVVHTLLADIYRVLCATPAVRRPIIKYAGSAVGLYNNLIYRLVGILRLVA